MLNNGTFIANRYEIVGQVGTGGMSDVYKAKDHALGRYVAIKVLKSEFSEFCKQIPHRGTVRCGIRASKHRKYL